MEYFPWVFVAWWVFSWVAIFRNIVHINIELINIYEIIILWNYNFDFHYILFTYKAIS